MADQVNIFPAPDGFGSSNLNPRIESYADLVYRVKSLLGWPVSQIELTDAQWASFVDEAIENWTAWEGNRKEETLVFCSNRYVQGCGVKLDDLIQIGCNTNYCFQTVTTESVTSVDVACTDLGTFTAYLSVTPFAYPPIYDLTNPYSLPFSGIPGQRFYLTFDPENPWNASEICDATCVSINPLRSQYFDISSNPSLSGIVFDFINNSSISNLASSVSAYIIGGYPLSAVPLTALGNELSAISPCYYDLSVFYPDNYYFPPVSACLNIGHGLGYIYPNCNTALINSCSALSSQFGLSPTWPNVVTNIVISSIEILNSDSNFAIISSFFSDYCNECLCNCSFLSSLTTTSYESGVNIISEDLGFDITSETGIELISELVNSYSTSSYFFEVYKTVLSGADGRIFDLSARDVSSATHLKLYNVPSCTTDGSIPLNSNNGILGTFTLCNSGLSTNGPMYISYAQFFKDHKPPAEILCDVDCGLCGWENNGFTMTYVNSAYGNCVRTTPEKVKVDVTFGKKNITTNIGTVSTFLSGSTDPATGRKRKVLGVFSLDTGSQTGYGGYGGDLLFNFDYALMGATFGYDLQGGRNALARNGYDLLTYHMAKSFVEMSRDLLRYVSYRFDPKTQYLRVTPEPPFSSMMGNGTDCGCENGYDRNAQCYIVGLYLEPTIQECLSEYWVREWVLARAMWTLGRIRSKFTGVILYGNIQLAGDQLAQAGQQRMDQLLKELRQDYFYGAPPGFYIG